MIFKNSIFFQRGGGLLMGVLELGNQRKFEITGNQHKKKIDTVQTRLRSWRYVITTGNISFKLSN